MPTKQKRRSRYSQTPRVWAGKVIHTRLTTTETELLFPLLARRPFIDAEEFSLLIGRNYEATRARFSGLASEEYVYLPVLQKIVDGNLRRKDIIALDDLGAQVIGLAHKPFRVLSLITYPHYWLSSRIGNSFEIGAQQNGFRYIYQPQILAKANCTLPRPHLLKVGEHYLIPDEPLFGLEKAGKYFFFYGFEADRDTENQYKPSATAKDQDRQSLEGKLALFMHILETRQYHQQWGIPNLYYPIVTIHHGTKRNAMQMWERMTKDKPSLRRFVLFQTHRDYKDPHEPADGRSVTQDWDRVGYPAFNLLTA